MRILGIGDYGDLGDLYWHLLGQGHEVRMSVSDPLYHDVYAGMVDRTDDWRRELPWIRAAGDQGVIIFETADRGRIQDDLRADGHQVIGGCAWGDRIEGDRAFGQEIMRRVGMRTAPVHHFAAYGDAIAHIIAHPARYVFKANGHHTPSTRNYVGRRDDGADVIAVIASARRAPGGDGPQDFILMDLLDGVETGVGAYFNGRRFVGPPCLDWEHKRLFPGDIGELTGEMGTLVTYRGGERLFAETLAPMAPLLAAAGYRGYINLNTIINDAGVWPLEFTCRFGYPGFAILAPLQTGGWEEVLRALLGHGDGFRTAPGYAVGVVLTMPPFPYLGGSAPSPNGAPISVTGTLSAQDQRHLHYGEVAQVRGQPVVAGASGYVLVATGSGAEVADARAAAYGLLARVVVPNGRYRNDIGLRFIERESAELRRLGYLPPASAATIGKSP